EVIRNETSANPILVRDHLIREIRADAEDGTDRPVAVDRVVAWFLLSQRIVHEPVLAAVDRKDVAAAPRISDLVEPGRRPGTKGKKLRGANVGRLHPFDDRIANKRGADLFSHR